MHAFTISWMHILYSMHVSCKHPSKHESTDSECDPWATRIVITCHGNILR